jgi:hypothetical protein
MKIDLDGSDGWVEVYNYGGIYYQDGDTLWMPKGATLTYQTWDNVKKYTPGWKTKPIDCTDLHPGFCDMQINLGGSGGWVEIYSYAAPYYQGGSIWMPTGATLTYQAWDKNKKYTPGWKTKLIDVDCSPLKPEFCNMSVDLGGSDGWVEIYSYAEPDKYKKDGDVFWMPVGATLTYQAWDNAKKYTPGWKTKPIDCTALNPGFCDMQIDLDGSDGWIEIYSYTNPYYQHGASIWMPKGATLTYRAWDNKKKITPGWKTWPIDCTPLKPGFCNMHVRLESGVWDKVEIYTLDMYKNCNYIWMPTGATITYRAYDMKGNVTCWQTKPIDCLALVPACKVHVVMPAGVWGEISGYGWIKNGDWIDIKPATYSYRLTNANKAVSTGWKSKTFSASDCCVDWNLMSEYCDMLVDLGGSDGWVEISGVDWYQTGAHLWMPKTATFSYRATNANKAVSTGWMPKNVDCTALAPKFCYMLVNLGGHEGWVEISGVNWFKDGDHVWMPVSATFSYRATNANKAISTGWKSKPVDCTDLAPEFCYMLIDLGGSDGWVEISGVGWYQEGAHIWMPVSATFSYRATNANKAISTGWIPKPVDCTALAPKFCHMLVDLGGSDGWVEISGVGWYQEGAHIWMPVSATFSYRATNANKAISTGWMPKPVDCTPLAPPFCPMLVSLERGVWSKAEISGVGWFVDQAKVWMPVSATFTYRALDIKNNSTCWLQKLVDCSPLVPECMVHIMMPPGVWVEIQNNGDPVQNCTKKNIKPIKGFYYRLMDAKKAVVTGWKLGSLTASNCCNSWNLTSEFCNMKITLGTTEGHVEIQNVGWFIDGDHVWMPKGAGLYYRATNANMAISTGWILKPVDCTDLAHPYCFMHVNLLDEDGKPSDGQVEIQNVTTGLKHCDHVWMPTKASFYYRAMNANGAIATGWILKPVDCTDLTHLYCNMHVNLLDEDGNPSDGQVDIQNVKDGLKHCNTIWMPTKASFYYRAMNANRAIATGWILKKVDCTDLTHLFCYMHVDLSDKNGKPSDGKVEIQNVPPKLVNYDHVWMPTQAAFYYRAMNANEAVSTGWILKKVDCTDLYHEYCNMHVDLRDDHGDASDGQVEIQNVPPKLVNCDHVWMPTQASFYYRAMNANGAVSTGWILKPVDCTTDLTHLFCHLHINPPAPYTQVEIQNVDWFAYCDYVWMPYLSAFYFRACDAGGQTCTGWILKKVDCTPLYK